MLNGVPHARPRHQRSRRSESTLAHRLFRVWHATPYRDAALDGAAKIADRCACESRNFGNRGHA